MALDNIKQELKTLFEVQNLAVLCTQADGQPYASLVGFAVSEDLKSVWVATPRETRKYANMLAEPRVALLVDSRTHDASDFQDATACTITGKVRELEGDEKIVPAAMFAEKLPQLGTFIQAPSSALFELQVKQFVFVSHFQQVTEFYP